MPVAILAVATLALPGIARADLLRVPIDGWSVVCAFYDHGGSDWACGGNTYSGHRGTDFAASYGTTIVAAADGVVVSTEDGYFDGCTSGSCEGGTTGLGNHVLLESADGTRTYYGHMKIWSVAVAEGDRVTCGQRIGEVGSSGLSTGNHCHFQVGTWQEEEDPYQGDCSARGATLWVDQGPYGSGGCTDGLPAATCEDNPCRDEPDVDRCEGTERRVCAGGRYQGNDCAAAGLVCVAGAGGSLCVSPACAEAPSGSVCDGSLLRACADGVVTSEVDCAAGGGTCDAAAGICQAPDPVEDPADGGPAAGGDDAADPGFDARPHGPRGGLLAGCRSLPAGSERADRPAALAWAVFAIGVLSAARRRAAR